MKNKKTENKTENKIENKYSYQQLFSSDKFKKKYQQDLAKVILSDKTYTIQEATDILDKYFYKK